MIEALYLFVVQSVLGAFDTLYYHEWRARLPGGLPGTREELVLHASRDFIYAILFGTLPFVRYEGAWTFVLGALLVAEVAITLRDFVVEDHVRRPQGGVFAGERVTHALMGILYGAALGRLVPEMLVDAGAATGFVAWRAPGELRVVLPLMSAGVLVSGLRDLAAAFGPRWFGYPWTRSS